MLQRPPRYIELSTARTISSRFPSFPSKTHRPFDTTEAELQHYLERSLTQAFNMASLYAAPYNGTEPTGGDSLGNLNIFYEVGFWSRVQVPWLMLLLF